MLLIVKRLGFLSRESRTKVDKQSSFDRAKQLSRYTISPRNNLHWAHAGQGFTNSRPLSTMGGGGNTSVAV